MPINTKNYELALETRQIIKAPENLKEKQNEEDEEEEEYLGVDAGRKSPKKRSEKKKNFPLSLSLPFSWFFLRQVEAAGSFSIYTWRAIPIKSPKRRSLNL